MAHRARAGSSAVLCSVASRRTKNKEQGVLDSQQLAFADGDTRYKYGIRYVPTFRKQGLQEHSYERCTASIVACVRPEGTC